MRFKLSKTRILATAKAEFSGIVFSFTDHLRRAKSRNLGIMIAKKAEERTKPYKDLIEITVNTIGYSENVVKALTCYTAASLYEQALLVNLKQQLQHYRKFRANIVSGISWLKRSLGLDKCTWKEFKSSKSYVWAAIVSANLLILARKALGLKTRLFTGWKLLGRERCVFSLPSVGHCVGKI